MTFQMNIKEKTIPGPKMNATNLYVTTTQIIMKCDPMNPTSWQDLYRLVPYLRNSLCCVVCSNLLVDPLTPTIAQCQHHLCRLCKGGKKKIKPACEECKECTDYTENRRLRILLQCYKKMCVSLINSQLFTSMSIQASQPGTGFERGASNLILLIKEGAAFQDDYKSKGGLPKSAYSILPCVYTNSTVIQNPSQPQATVNSDNKNALLNLNTQNRPFYSVVYPGNGSKITLKRKQKESGPSSTKQREFIDKSLFKRLCTVKPKKGCRCGNATATPGKLTCCGQRCPCYVDSKACVECKCRGCRNPHRIDGQKVMPLIPELQQIQIVSSTQPPVLPPNIHNMKNERFDLDAQFSAFDQIVVGGYNTMPLSSDLIPLGFSEEDTELSVV